MHGGDAGECLAGADRVRDQRALAVLDDARHRVALVLPELDVGRHPRQREVVAAVRARGDAVALAAAVATGSGIFFLDFSATGL